VTPEALLPAFFALDRYTRRRSDDACATHLFALVCERLGHLALGSTLAARAIGLVEAAYELTEDAALERPFAIANASAGRVALGQGEHARALEAFESALGLLPEPESGADIEDARLRALCHFGAGLAHGGLGQPTEALEALEAARVAAAQDATMTGHVTVLIAQTLWSLGTDDARESAKSQLLQWSVRLLGHHTPPDTTVQYCG
jgi:superkiller protein 3